MRHSYELDQLYDKLNLTGRVFRVGEYSVGTGGCSNVWEGYYEGKKVAVKVIREVGVSSNELTLKRRLVREVRAWSDLHHRNVLPLLGFVYAFDLASRLASLVSPWMPHGTATRYLETRPTGEKIRVLTNVADGLCYLHRYDVVHGDIKGDNILIDESFEPRLADFGLSTIVSETKAAGETITQTQSFFGSLRWTAKELFSTPEENGAPGVTRESDIWAFGMTILELFTSLPPYYNIKYDPQVIIAIHNGRLPDEPDEHCGLDDDMWALCTSCWAENPKLRPTTKSLSKKLWELEVKSKLIKAQRKKRKSRDPDSPDKANGERSLEERLKKSPKLSTLAELDGGRSSPGTPRSLASPSRELVRTPSSGPISRSSSFSSATSSSSSDTGDLYGIDPRKLFSGNARTEWAVHPAWTGHGSRLRPERTQTEPTTSQRYDYFPCHANDAMRTTRSVDSVSDAASTASMPNFPLYTDDNGFPLVRVDRSGSPFYGGSGLQLEGLGGSEANINPYYYPVDSMSLPPMHSSYEMMDPSQWTSFPSPFDSQTSPTSMRTPLASHAYGILSPPSPSQASPSPSPFMPQTPIFSKVFGMDLNEEPLPFSSGSMYGYDVANPVDFTTMPHGVLSPAISDADTPFLGFTEEPSHIPNPSDTPVIGSYDSFDDFEELGSDFALIGGIGVDDNVLQSRRFEMKSSASEPSSRQGSGSTVTGASSCSAQSSRQSSGGAPSKHLPPSPQLSPLLSSF